MRRLLLITTIGLSVVSCSDQAPPYSWLPESAPTENSTESLDSGVEGYIPSNPTVFEPIIIFDTASAIIAVSDPYHARNYTIHRSEDGGPWESPMRLRAVDPHRYVDYGVSDGRDYVYRVIASRGSSQDTTIAAVHYTTPSEVFRRLESAFRQGSGVQGDFRSLLGLFSEQFTYYGMRRDHSRFSHGLAREARILQDMFDPRGARRIVHAELGFCDMSVEKRTVPELAPKWNVSATVGLDAVCASPVHGDIEIHIEHRVSFLIGRSRRGCGWTVLEWRDHR